MKNKKKIIIYSIIAVLVIILIVTLLLVKALKEEDKMYDEILESKEGIGSADENPVKLIRTNNTVTYYTVDECLKSYFRMLEIEDSAVLMTYLNENYIKDNDIHENNILTVLEKYEDYNTYRTAEMYEIANYNITTYYVKARIDHKNIYFIVHLDVNNQTFDIEPITEENYQKREQMTSSSMKSITNKVYNYYVYKDLNDEVTSKLYFADYIKTMILYEAPHKLETTLKDLKDILGNRKIVLARELTKIHEEYIRENINVLIEKAKDLKGEIVLLIEGLEKKVENNLLQLSLQEHYRYYEERGLSKKEIIKQIAKDRNVNKNEIYQKFIDKN